MKKKLLLNLVFFACTAVSGQTPDTLWTKTYGDSSYDSGSSIIQTNNNSLIISGRIGTQLGGAAHTSDIWIFGIDEDGNELWSHNYGGMGSGEIEAASGDEYFVAAETYNQGTQEDMQLLKINSVGDTLWAKTFYYTQHEYSPDIERTPDGGLVLLEYTYGFPKGALLIKVNESGDTLWTRFFPDDLYSLNPSSPRIDNNKGILFLIQELDSTFIYKTDSSGNLFSKNKICSNPYRANDILITEEGNYLLLGNYQPNYDTSAIWVSLLNNNLNTIWSHTFLSNFLYAYPTNIVKSLTGGYIIIGNEAIDYQSQTDGTLFKINDSGNVIWKKSYGGVLSEKFRDILILGDNQFLVVGNTASFGAGKEDAWVLKFSADTATTAVKNDANSKSPESYTLNQNYPNPFNPSTKISWQVPASCLQTLKVYDVLGSEVATLVDEYKPAGKYEVEWNASKYPSGVYFYQLLVSALQSKDGKTENFIETKKMILLK